LLTRAPASRDSILEDYKIVGWIDRADHQATVDDDPTRLLTAPHLHRALDGSQVFVGEPVGMARLEARQDL
jgi:hypothetical protein